MSWNTFHDRSLLQRSFWSFVLSVFDSCSSVWCSAAYSHLKLLDRVVRCAVFLADAVLECNLVHRRSEAVLCSLFKTKSKTMHPPSGALPLPYVPARVTRGSLVPHLHSFAIPRCRTSEYRIPLCSPQCLFGTVFLTMCLMVWDWRGLRAEPMLSC